MTMIKNMIGEIREERGEERGVYHLDTLELIFFRSFRYNLNGEILLIERFLPLSSPRRRDKEERDYEFLCRGQSDRKRHEEAQHEDYGYRDDNEIHSDLRITVSFNYR